ncbi:ComF family protein [bacterium]|nr:ComF family protein [bacterium]
MIIKIKKLINDFLFPVKCVSCGAIDSVLCKNCKNSIKKFDKGFCYSCLREGKDFSVCNSCKKGNYLDGVLVLGDYKDYCLKKLIWDLKFNFIKDSAEPLALMLYERFKNINKEDYIVSSVPLNEKRLKYRGFNQSEIIARKFAGLMDLDYKETLLRDKNTPSQKGLTKLERSLNVDGVFNVSGDFNKRNVYLLDDVITTGATLNSCAKTLKKTGINEVWGVVLARD